MTRRWRKRRSEIRPERIEQPPKERLHMSAEEQLIQRLRTMRLPEPPPGVKERSLQAYRDWLNSQKNRNPWRDE
jgi:hypothetical protein